MEMPRISNREVIKTSAKVAFMPNLGQRKSGPTPPPREAFLLPIQPTNNTLTHLVHRHRGQRTPLLRSCQSPPSPYKPDHQFL